MKILWLYQYCNIYNYDHWFHLDFANYFNKINDITLYTYGPNIPSNYSPLCNYDINYSLDNLYSMFNFDVIICNTKSRMFSSYTPPMRSSAGKEERINCWIPKDFDSWTKTPKIMIEEDYHYENSDAWYEEMKFDLILQRHLNNARNPRGNKCRHLWFPFSVDINTFRYNTGNKYNFIAFCGNNPKGVYPARDLAINSLKKTAYLRDFGRTKINNDYLDVLSSHKACISCSSKYFITPAKMFEIMASGAILLTDNNDYGLSELFDDNTYFTFNESNILDVSKQIIEMGEKDRINFTNKAFDVIKHKHSNEVRIKELLGIIKEMC